MNWRRNRGKVREKGFTLIEGVVAVSILLVVLLIAYPIFQRYAINGNLKAAARDIMSDIANLKQRAMTENATFSIIFDVNNNNYTIQRAGVTIQTKTPTYFASDIRITSTTHGGSSINFQRRGTTTAGTLNLSNSRGSTAALTTNLTGRTHVQFDLK